MNRSQINKHEALNNIMEKILILRKWATQTESFAKD